MRVYTYNFLIFIRGRRGGRGLTFWLVVGTVFKGKNLKRFKNQKTKVKSYK